MLIHQSPGNSSFYRPNNKGLASPRVVSLETEMLGRGEEEMELQYGVLHGALWQPCLRRPA